MTYTSMYEISITGQLRGQVWSGQRKVDNEEHEATTYHLVSSQSMGTVPVSTKCIQIIWLSVENNVSLQDNSDDPKESNLNGDMEWMRRLKRFNQKPVPMIDLRT